MQLWVFVLYVLIKFCACRFNCYERWCLCSIRFMGFDMVHFFWLTMWELVFLS